MANDTKNAFISHIHEDDAGLADLKTLLEKSGMTVRNYSITSDKFNNAKSPEYIKSEILAPRIKACSVMVVYITKNTKDSDWVNWEIEYAAKQGKKIVGVWERGSNGCEIPDALDEFCDAIVAWNGGNIVAAINGDYSVREDPSGNHVTTPIPIPRHPCG